MEKIFSLVLLAILALCLVVMITCGGGEKKAERSDDEAPVDDDSLVINDDPAAGGDEDGHGRDSCMRWYTECLRTRLENAKENCDYLMNLRKYLNYCALQAYRDYDDCLDNLDCSTLFGWDAAFDQCINQVKAALKQCD